MISFPANSFLKSDFNYSNSFGLIKLQMERFVTRYATALSEMCQSVCQPNLRCTSQLISGI